jgi:hypothetical protein
MILYTHPDLRERIDVRPSIQKTGPDFDGAAEVLCDAIDQGDLDGVRAALTAALDLAPDADEIPETGDASASLATERSAA